MLKINNHPQYPNNNTLVEFFYDALGRRIRKYDVAQDLTTLFYYDQNWRVISEYEQTGTGTNNAKPCRFFVYGNGIDEVLAMFYPGSPASGDPNDMNDLEAFVTTWLLDANDVNFNSNYDNPNDNFIDYLDFATLNSGRTYTPVKPEKRWYYMKDALGSVMGLMGSHPNAKSEFHLYDVYGKPNTTSAVGNPYMFTCRRVDVLDGGKLVEQYNRNRYYDYATGRWLSVDPYGVVPNSQPPNNFGPISQYSDGLIYGYIGNNPVIWIDPYGYGRFWDSVKSGLQIVGGAISVLSTPIIATWPIPGARILAASTLVFGLNTFASGINNLSRAVIWDEPPALDPIRLTAKSSVSWTTKKFGIDSETSENIIETTIKVVNTVEVATTCATLYAASRQGIKIISKVGERGQVIKETVNYYEITSKGNTLVNVTTKYERLSGFTRSMQFTGVASGAAIDIINTQVLLNNALIPSISSGSKSISETKIID